jgi:hypothetical protein
MFGTEGEGKERRVEGKVYGSYLLFPSPLLSFHPPIQTYLEIQTSLSKILNI